MSENDKTENCHLPRALNGRWVCGGCGRILRPDRKRTECQWARKLKTFDAREIGFTLAGHVDHPEPVYNPKPPVVFR